MKRTKLVALGALAALALAGPALAQDAANGPVPPSPAPVKPVAVPQGGATTNDLGDKTTDLVFVPVTPCRIVDTRNAAGAFSSAETRSYFVGGETNFSSYGGVATTCNIPAYSASTTEPGALVLHITVVSQSASGWITAWPFGASMPNASVVNWSTSGQVDSNTTIVATTVWAGNDFSIRASSATHVIIDVMGYFIAPAPSTLDRVVQTANSGAVAASTSGSVSTPACPAGYVMTGGGGGGHSFNTYIAYSGPLGSTTAATSWIVSGKTGVSSDNFDAFAYCVRTPGQVRS